MGLHLSTAHMAKARELHPAAVQPLTCQWRHGMVAKTPAPT